jgi:diacylglycerol kinase (ATP)
VLLVVLRPGAVWCALLFLSITLVLAMEMANSALEYLADHVHPDWADAIGDAKDAAAGAVLIASINALLCGGAMIVAFWR